METNHLIFEASAPGRLDIMGGIADYSGSLVLEMPLPLNTKVSLTLKPEAEYGVFVTSSDEGEKPFQLSKEFWAEILTLSLSEAAKKIKSLPEGSWAIYPIGCLLVAQANSNITLPSLGITITINSQVPVGKGVSSSAALEIATLKAWAMLTGYQFSGTELARWGQQAENHMVGAPCGLMDQLSSAYGEAENLIPILCRPDEIQSQIPIPSAIHFKAIDSGVRHAVSGASYSDVRIATFAGLKIINQFRQQEGKTPLTYLTELSVSEFESSYKAKLPLTLSGTEVEGLFSKGELLTPINPSFEYDIVNCTSHPIYENERVAKFISTLQLLNSNWSTSEAEILGSIMYQADNSYRKIGLGSDATNTIVDKVKNGEYPSIIGAKITGGGSGGTVALLCLGTEGLTQAEQLANEWKAQNPSAKGLLY